MEGLHLPQPLRLAALDRHPRALAWGLGLLGVIVGGAGSWIPSYWGDEAASVMSADRTWPSLMTLLGRIDGVHGVYYALLHLWTSVFGDSELATRAPSAIAVGLMVAGIVLVAREYLPTSVAAGAGLIAVILPRATYMATEARSYAMSAAVAVWLTLLLSRALRSGARRRVWLGYALASAAGMYLFLYLGLLLVVHGVYIGVTHRAHLRRWATATLLTVALAIPIVLVGYAQRHQISFLARRHYATVSNVLVRQWFGRPLVAVVCWALILAGIVLLVRRHRDPADGDNLRRQLAVLAVTWLTLPTAVLLIVNATVSPLYNVRYLSFCTPAVALLVAMGAAEIARLAPSRFRPIVVPALLATVMLTALPVYVGQRTPWAKDGGSDWRAVSSYLARNATEGAAVVFDQDAKPSRDPRLATRLYPSGFTALDDIALQTPYAQRQGLWDAVRTNRDAVLGDSTPADVWAVELAGNHAEPADITMLISLGYTVTSIHIIHRTTVYHLLKD